MPSVCFYFQVHQPYRLRRYGVFDVGRRRDYFDTKLDETVLRKVAEKCYRPMNALVERMIEIPTDASAPPIRSPAARSSRWSAGRPT